MKVRALVEFWGAGNLHAPGSIIETEDASAWLRDGVVELYAEPVAAEPEVVQAPAPIEPEQQQQSAPEEKPKPKASGKKK